MKQIQMCLSSSKNNASFKAIFPSQWAFEFTKIHFNVKFLLLYTNTLERLGSFCHHLSLFKQTISILRVLVM